MNKRRLKTEESYDRKTFLPELISNEKRVVNSAANSRLISSKKGRLQSKIEEYLRPNTVSESSIVQRKLSSPRKNPLFCKKFQSQELSDKFSSPVKKKINSPKVLPIYINKKMTPLNDIQV